MFRRFARVFLLAAPLVATGLGAQTPAAPSIPNTPAGAVVPGD